MSCCGGKVGKKIVTIAEGYRRLVTDKIGLTKSYEWAGSRLAICRSDECGQATWMTMAEYGAWLKDNSVEVVKNFADLEKLPPLPKHKLDNKRRNLFCRLCKCYIPAKARVAYKHCPLDKWREAE